MTNQNTTLALLLHAVIQIGLPASKTCCLFSGICIQLAGGTIACKCKSKLTIALSSTEAEYMAACDLGRMCLFVCSILWDLEIPQEAATIAYKDNDGCTALGNA
jgi:hypothetical protein